MEIRTNAVLISIRINVPRDLCYATLMRFLDEAARDVTVTTTVQAMAQAILQTTQALTNRPAHVVAEEQEWLRRGTGSDVIFRRCALSIADETNLTREDAHSRLIQAAFDLAGERGVPPLSLLDAARRRVISDAALAADTPGYQVRGTHPIAHAVQEIREQRTRDGLWVHSTANPVERCMRREAIHMSGITGESRDRCLQVIEQCMQERADMSDLVHWSENLRDAVRDAGVLLTTGREEPEFMEVNTLGESMRGTVVRRIRIR